MAFKANGCLLAIAGTCGIKLPEDAHSLAPWVAITFEGSGSTITVGNESSPATDPKHVACIKSFEFGYSDGLTLRVTIHDEEGGSFVQFMKNLLKNYICLKNGNPATVRMKVQFGWAKTGCPTPLPATTSPIFYCLSDSVETTYTQGKFIFELTGKDLCHRMFEGGCYEIKGGDGKEGIPLTQAIRLVMTNGCSPNIERVRFLRFEGGKAVPCGFSEGGLEGPKKKWPCNGKDKMAMVRGWLDGWPTDRKKGWVLQYNSEVPNGELIVWEDAKPKEVRASAEWDATCIGTYIVNGGLASSVIEFNPKIRWDFARLTSNGGQLGVNTVNGTGQAGAKNPGLPAAGLDAKSNPCAGHLVGTPPTENHKNTFGKDADKKNREGKDADHRAVKILTDNIEADLVIVGDPTIAPPSEAMWAKNVTIVVLNSYFLRDGGGKACLEWSNATSGGGLAVSACNEVLTNKGWIVKGVSHRIEAGKYTTTLKVFLTTPGTDIPPNAQFGAWNGGWVPNPQC